MVNHRWYSNVLLVELVKQFPALLHSVPIKSSRVGLTLLTRFYKVSALSENSTRHGKNSYYGLEVCLLNSFVIFKAVKQNPTDFLSYRTAIVHHLLDGKCFQGRRGRIPTRPLDVLDARTLNREYHSVALEEKRQDCVVCAKIVAVNNLDKNHRNRTNTVCVTCDCKPLCLHSKWNCWEKWHSLVEYWR